MNAYEAGKAIYQQWMSAWPSASGGIAFVFDNDVVDETSLYARVAIHSITSEQHTLGPVGSRKWLRAGFIMVTLKGPSNQGRKSADVLTSAVKSTLEGVRLAASGTEEGVFTFAASVDEQPPDGQFWILAIRVPFQYYETR